MIARGLSAVSEAGRASSEEASPRPRVPTRGCPVAAPRECETHRLLCMFM